jgi:hypothetical protein
MVEMSGTPTDGKRSQSPRKRLTPAMKSLDMYNDEGNVHSTVGQALSAAVRFPRRQHDAIRPGDVRKLQIAAQVRGSRYVRVTPAS